MLCTVFGLFSNIIQPQSQQLGVSNQRFRAFGAAARLTQPFTARSGASSPAVMLATPVSGSTASLLCHGTSVLQSLMASAAASQPGTPVTPSLRLTVRGCAPVALICGMLSSTDDEILLLVQVPQLETLFFQAFVTTVDTASSSGGNGARLSVNAFASALEALALALFADPEAKTVSSADHAALCAAVYRLVTQHLAPLVDEAGAKLHRRIERYMSQKRSDMKLMTANRPQLSALFGSCSGRVSSSA